MPRYEVRMFYSSHVGLDTSGRAAKQPWRWKAQRESVCECER